MRELDLSLCSRWKFHDKVLKLIETGICSPRSSCSVIERGLQILSSPHFTWPPHGGWPPPLSPDSS